MLSKLRVFTSTYAGLNYTFADGTVGLFKPVAGKPTYYATEAQAAELRTKQHSHITEVAEPKADAMVFAAAATGLHKVGLLVQ